MNEEPMTNLDQVLTQIVQQGKVPLTQLAADMDRWPNLAACEKIIEQGLASFITTGMALITVRDRALYKQAGYSTFEDYCQERWGISRPRAYQLIESATTVQEMSTIVDTPLPQNEGQARELKGLEPEVAAQVITKAKESGKITANSIAEAREQITQPEPKASIPRDLPKPPPPELTEEDQRAIERFAADVRRWTRTAEAIITIASISSPHWMDGFNDANLNDPLFSDAWSIDFLKTAQDNIAQLLDWSQNREQ